MSDQSGNPTVAQGSRISRSTRTRVRKKKPNQIPFGILVFIALCVIGIIFLITNETIGFYLFSGIAFGFILQRSRFCFTASLRDPYLTGSTSLTKAVLVAFAIATLGFWAIKYGAFRSGLPIPGQGFIAPISLATIIGGLMFGIGMVISGGCASGTLMRVGEGFTMQVIAIIFFVVGSLWGAHDFEWWKLNVILQGKKVFLPDVFGWFGAIALQLGLIALIWISADKFAKRKAQAAAKPKE